jgi:hypothetical protein
MPTPTVRIYIRDGLVTHVAGPNRLTVRVIDFDIEGSEVEDTTPITDEDRAIVEGLFGFPDRAYIRDHETTDGDAIMFSSEMPSLSVAESAILLLEQTIATRPDYFAKGMGDYKRAWKIIESWRGKRDDSKDLLDALDEAKAALVGDSNDAEHDALVSFVQAMGLEIPECDCDERSWHGEGHDSACPQRAWQKEGN